MKIAARRAGVVLVAGLALASLAGCVGSNSNKAGGPRKEKPTVVTMTMASWSFPADPKLATFLNGVTRLSGGTIRIEPQNNWRRGQVDYENGLIRDVKAGKANLGWAGSRAWDSVGVKSFRALHAPLLIDSYALQEQVVRSPLVAKMLRGLNHIGLVGLGVLPGPMRRPLGVKGPLVKPADYAGLTIGVQQSRVADATMRALGAKPVWFPAAGEVKGFDGIEQQVASIEGNAYDYLGKFLTSNVNLWPRPLVVFANRKAFDSLTTDQQDILRRAVVSAIPDAAAIDPQDDRDTGAILCKRGLRFVIASRDELAALRRAVQPVYDKLERDPPTKAFIGRIEAMRAKLAAPPDAVHCSQSRVDRANAPSPIEGVYQTVVTRNEFIKALQLDAKTVPPSLGDMTMMLELVGGRWLLREAPEGWSVRGPYKVDARRLRMWADGEASPWLDVRWSRYRGLLTFKGAPGAALAPYWASFDSWRRLGGARPITRPRTRQTLPPNGVYRLRVSVQDMRRAGVDEADALNNGGLHELTLKNGHFTIVDPGTPGEAPGRGTYRVRGTLVRFDWFNGWAWSGRWKFVDGALRFTVFDAPEGLFDGVFWGYGPWERVS